MKVLCILVLSMTSMCEDLFDTVSPRRGGIMTYVLKTSAGLLFCALERFCGCLYLWGLSLAARRKSARAATKSPTSSRHIPRRKYGFLPCWFQDRWRLWR